VRAYTFKEIKIKNKMTYRNQTGICMRRSTKKSLEAYKKDEDTWEVFFFKIIKLIKNN